MSADRQALLDAMRDDPYDDRLLLVFADWLEDNGDPDRAEYIRFEKELHELDGQDPRYPEFFFRGERLWRKNSKRWSQGLPSRAVGYLRYGGVVRHLEVTAAAFLKGADALREQPLSRLVLTSVGKKLAALAGCPALAGVRGLELYDTNIDEKDLAVLVASPHLGALHALHLTLARLQPPAAEVLASSPLLGQLRTLDLGFCEPRLWARELQADDLNNHWRERSTARVHRANAIGDSGLGTLSGSPRMERLETLVLAYNGISAEGVRRLAESPHVKSLRRLDLSFNRLGVEGIVALVESPLLAQLEWLEIQASGHLHEGARAVARSPNAKNLRLLDLSGSYSDSSPLLHDGTARELARSPHLAGLEHLLLFCNALSDDGVAALLRSKHLTSLRTLSLGRNPIGDAGAQMLASSDRLGQLTLLDLRDCNITSEGATAFIRSKKVGEQLHLYLTENRLDADTVAALRERFLHVAVSDPRTSH
jgi:uncharacterized protein (TIGR02996 family)